MYRSALEHLLYEQGFKDGMCGKKIGDLVMCARSYPGLRAP